jgi:hypothetical protein
LPATAVRSTCGIRETLLLTGGDGLPSWLMLIIKISCTVVGNGLRNIIKQKQKDN